MIKKVFGQIFFLDFVYNVDVLLNSYASNFQSSFTEWVGKFYKNSVVIVKACFVDKSISYTALRAPEMDLCEGFQDESDGN
jgi:hypothetical protein